MRRRAWACATLAAALSSLPYAAAAQSRVDRDMAQLAAASPVAQAARHEVAQAIAALRDPVTRQQTRSALLDPADCVRSRAGLTVAEQTRITAIFQQRGWIDAGLSPAAARDGLFPPLVGDGGVCPHIGVPAVAAPGGNSGSHHSWPGGLAIHIAVNLRSAAALMDGYATIEHADADRDRTNGAILWHDWAKVLVLRWRSDGTTTEELTVAGTGAHHVLGLAEAMRRGLPPAQIVAQACAHGPATGDTQARVQRWLDAAAILARVDGNAYAAQPTSACLLTHLADQNWMYSDEAVVRAESWLKARSAALGVEAATDPARFRVCVLLPALAWLGAERIDGALNDPAAAIVTVRSSLAAAGPYTPCLAGASPGK